MEVEVKVEACGRSPRHVKNRSREMKGTDRSNNAESYM